MPIGVFYKPESQFGSVPPAPLHSPGLLWIAINLNVSGPGPDGTVLPAAFIPWSVEGGGTLAA